MTASRRKPATKPEPPSRWMNARDVATEIRCERSKAYEIMWEIGPFSLGRNLRITRVAFDAWATRMENTRG
jgi:hypothetical protein